MPAIVSKEVFEAAQKRLIQNKRQGGQRANGLTPEEVPRFWLTGKLYCGKCGTPMQGCSGTSGHKGAKHYYYACGAARKRKCSLKYVKKDKIEAIACFMLSQCLKDSEMLASLAVDVAEYYKKEHEDTGLYRRAENGAGRGRKGPEQPCAGNRAGYFFRNDADAPFGVGEPEKGADGSH